MMKRSGNFSAALIFSLQLFFVSRQKKVGNSPSQKHEKNRYLYPSQNE